MDSKNTMEKLMDVPDKWNEWWRYDPIAGFLLQVLSITLWIGFAISCFVAVVIDIMFFCTGAWVFGLLGIPGGVAVCLGLFKLAVRVSVEAW